MKLCVLKANDCGLSRVEVLILTIAIATLLAIVASNHAVDERPLAQKMSCINNLQEINNALNVFASATGGQYPMQNFVENEKENAFLNIDPARIFKTLSNELHTTERLICPADSRKRATTFSVLKATNTSYFISLDAKRGLANIVLAGDRNLLDNGKPLVGSVFNLGTNASVSWSFEMHKIKSMWRYHPYGDVIFADGAVKTIRSQDWVEIIKKQNTRTNRISLP